MGAYGLSTAAKRALNHFFSLRAFNLRNRRDVRPGAEMAPKSLEHICIGAFCAFISLRTSRKESDMSEKQTKQSKGRGGVRPGAGRPKGSLDKGNALIRVMVADALNKAGGVDYLVRQADEKPAAFLALLGKVLPVQIEGGDGGPVAHSLTVTFK